MRWVLRGGACAHDACKRHDRPDRVLQTCCKKAWNIQGHRCNDCQDAAFSNFLSNCISEILMTYTQAANIYKKRHGRVVKTCWIADVKRRHGKTKHESWNRIGVEPKYPCPDHVFPRLETILKELRMI